MLLPFLVLRGDPNDAKLELRCGVPHGVRRAPRACSGSGYELSCDAGSSRVWLAEGAGCSALVLPSSVRAPKLIEPSTLRAQAQTPPNSAQTFFPSLLSANTSVHQWLARLFDALVATGIRRLTAAFAQHAAQVQCEAL